MTVTTGVAIYFLIWWLSLFAVLPWGVRSQGEQGGVVPGSDPGAPVAPSLLKRLMWTTVVSAVVFAAGVVAYEFRLVTLDDLSTMWGVLR